MTYSLIIPIYNEIRTLTKLLESLNNLDNNIEIIIIDDGSNDGTKELLLKQNKIKIYRNDKNLGKGLSIIKGVDLATNQSIILMDGDLEVDINEIPKLIARYEEQQVNVLTGIRWVKKKFPSWDINTLGNFFINEIFNLLFQSNQHDVLCCVKILNKKLFRSLNIQSKKFNIEVELMAKLLLSNSTVDQVKVQYNRRSQKQGKKLRFYDSWNIICTMVSIWLKK